jgi:hypothetical protein
MRLEGGQFLRFPDRVRLHKTSFIERAPPDGQGCLCHRLGSNDIVIKPEGRPEILDLRQNIENRIIISNTYKFIQEMWPYTEGGADETVEGGGANGDPEETILGY